MGDITIQLPKIEADQFIEVEVKVNGKKKMYNYRVEIFYWEECKKEEERAECLKDMLERHDKNWQLVHIGSATDTTIPLMFKELN